MVGEHLSVVLGASLGGDPFRSQAMFLCTLAAWHLAVRDVAHQDVEERVLVVRQRRAARVLHEVLPLQRMEVQLG